jgi:hypothetical protein
VIRTTNEFLYVLRAARRVSTPLICARTADPASALGLIQESLNGKAESVPVTVWDILSGLRPVNAAAKENLCRVLDERDPSTVGPADSLVLAAEWPTTASWSSQTRTDSGMIRQSHKASGICVTTSNPRVPCWC